LPAAPVWAETLIRTSAVGINHFVTCLLPLAHSAFELVSDLVSSRNAALGLLVSIFGATYLIRAAVQSAKLAILNYTHITLRR
jgi:hypothetical protein